MLISVVIPVYQAKNSLRRSVNSIVKNNEIEILLIDDGSQDGSSQLCDELAKENEQIRVVHQKNQGVSAARNQGIKMAKGTYILFLDADDWFISDSWSTIISYAKQNIDFVGFSYYSVFPDGVKIEEPFPDRDIIRDYDSFMKILLGTPLLHTCWGKLFRRDLINQQGIEFSASLTIGEDYIFVMEYCKYIKSQLLVNNPVLCYYQNPVGVVRNFEFIKYEVCLKQVWDYCKQYTSEKKRKNYIDIMCQYQLLTMIYYMRMISINEKGKRKYDSLKRFFNADFVREIVNKTKKENLSGYRKLEYNLIKWKLAVIATGYFNIKGLLKKKFR